MMIFKKALSRRTFLRGAGASLALPQLGSLELGIESPEILGTCDGLCTYTHTICWSGPTTPLPMDNQPRAVFERLFGDSDSTNSREQLARIRRDGSILDLVGERVSRL